MAHPDDCEILAGGTMIRLRDAGWETHVITMTPGDCGSAELGPIEIAAIRRREGAAAADAMGATYHCLESRDLFVCYDEPTLRRAFALLRSIGPTLMITHSLEDYMLDHEVTARIARAASFGYAMPNAGAGPVTPGSRVPYLYYADPLEGIDPYGQPIRPTTFVDVSAVVERKLEALARHASQRNWLLKHHGIDEYLDGTRRWAARRGQEAGVAYAEAFRQHRGHAYPADDILAAAFAPGAKA
jgi:LmbE family N-acetylglucosaminyl deacetylase